MNMDEPLNSEENGRASALRSTIGQTLKSQAIILGSIVALMWFLEILDKLILGGALDGWGVKPLTAIGLRGILFMPFLHKGFIHLLANTVPFVVLGWLVMVRRTADFYIVTVIAMLVGGLGVWLLGGSHIHIGASGLVFGYFGYLVFRAYFERSLKSFAIALVVIIFYGGLFLSLFVVRAGISWQGHLFGFAGGVLAAYWLVKNGSEANGEESPPPDDNGIRILD
jgi:membrane associated rhomboid family serine protease